MKINELTIKIYEGTQEPGFFYDIYDTNDIDEEIGTLDGGFCTTTIENALEMAYEQALVCINDSNENKIKKVKLPKGLTLVTNNSKVNGSYLQDSIVCSYKELTDLFGKEHSTGDGEKVDAEWIFETPHGVVTIYNYKDGFNYLGSEGLGVSDIREWHIGGHNKESANFIINLIIK